MADTKTHTDRAEAFIFDRPANEKRIVGALKMCIDAHGPITSESLSSAARRVESVLRSAYKQKLRDLPEPDLSAQIKDCETRLGELRRARAGTMIDDARGWCVSCGNSVVDVASGFDTCTACVASI